MQSEARPRFIFITRSRSSKGMIVLQYDWNLSCDVSAL